MNCPQPIPVRLGSERVRPHGKRSTYDKYGCRCDLCIAANTEHARRNR